MACPTITTIPNSECIGNSLVTINSNFNILRDAICDIKIGISVAKDGDEIGTNIQGFNFIGNGVEVVAAPNQTANIIINQPIPIGVKSLEEQSLNSGGGRNNFFILKDGSLRVCGLNSWGELGVGIADAVYLPRVAGFDPPLELEEGVDKVYSHGAVSYVITSKGRLYGAGFNLDGQLGQGNTQQNYAFYKFINVLGENSTALDFYTNPVLGYAAAPSDPVVEITTGTGKETSYITVYALTKSGALYAWGDNSRGQTSIPKSSTSSTEIIVSPQRVFSTGGTLVNVRAGGNNTATTVFVKDSRGKVFVCGRNQDGQAGINNLVSDLTTFQEVVGLPSTYVANNIRVGGNTDNISTWITLTDGSLWAAGLDNNCQVSGKLTNTNTYQSSFAKVAGFSSTDYVDDVVAHADADATTCWALILDGTGYRLKGWGDNTYGQLGIGDTYPGISTVEPISNPKWPWLVTGAKVLDVVVAGDGPLKTTLVLDSNRELWAAGYGQTGLLGRGQVSNSNVFVRVIYNKALGVPVQLRSTNNDSGYANFLVLLNTGKVLAWGFDSDTKIDTTVATVFATTIVSGRAGKWSWWTEVSVPAFTQSSSIIINEGGQLGIDASPQITSIPSLVQILN